MTRETKLRYIVEDIEKFQYVIMGGGKILPEEAIAKLLMSVKSIAEIMLEDRYDPGDED